MSPALYALRFQESIKQKNTFVMRLKGGELDVEYNVGGLNRETLENRGRRQVKQIAAIQHLLEDFVAVWNPHDSPRVLPKYEERHALLEAGRGGELFSPFTCVGLLLS
jgi:hypothetical protein